MSVKKPNNQIKKCTKLTTNDISNICGISIISDSEESFSESCFRYGHLYEEEEDMTPIHYQEDYMTSVQIALQLFCEDNPKIPEEEFTTWYQQLIDDDELFRLDKRTIDLLDDVESVFDAKMDQWIAKGVLDANYSTVCIYWSIIILAIREVYEKLSCHNLDDKLFFKDSIFGKYKITALDYADDCTLNTFSNPHAYNRYDTEGLFLLARAEFGDGDDYEAYRKTLVVYQEVKDIVYEDPNRLLADTKKILEAKARKDKKRKHQYAVLYACAVIEYWLKTERVAMP